MRPYNENRWIVEDAAYLEDYKVKVWFRDGSVKIVDLEEAVFKERPGDVFVPLQDQQFFSQVRYDEELGTITWSNEADFAPEFLYEIGEEVEAEINFEAYREELIQPDDKDIFS